MFTDKSLWQKLFGTIWQTLINTNTEIGGFLINHETKEVFVDSNSMHLMGLRKRPSYDDMLLLMDSLDEDISERKIEVIYAENSDKLAFGYCRSSVAAAETLPVCTQAKLFAAMSENSRNSILALIRLEESAILAIPFRHISAALNAIIRASINGTLISSYSENCFWVYIPHCNENKSEYLKKLQMAVNEAVPTMSFSAGFSADNVLPMVRMQTAEFTLYDAEACGGGFIAEYSEERYNAHKNEYDVMKKLFCLIDLNGFSYHFQPIVSAATGDIIAYEALMRTDPSINMAPLEILDAAQKYGRLYDIEKATMRNTLDIISTNQTAFRNKKLFVNSITAHHLSESDWKTLEEQYGELMEKMVIEFTEQTELNNDRLAVIRERLKRNNIKMAIDDYGTGYSNTTNLLRYAPNYVKIDRLIVKGIDSNAKMQKLVSGIIDFVHSNGYLALAEGVETFEELRTMIRLGIDLIQGYYISKPKPIMLEEISDSIRSEIIKINIECSQLVNKVYLPVENEIVDLYKLATENYTSMFIEVSSVTITGGGEHPVNLLVNVKDGIETKITLRNASLANNKNENDEPVISLGANSKVELCLEGTNSLLRKGIFVPESAQFTLTGIGSLNIFSEAHSAYGIGTDNELPYGNINILLSGKLDIQAAGEYSVGIGGGKCSDSSVLNVLGGDVHINCSGGNSIAIGSFNGGDKINIKKCTMAVDVSASNSLGIGAMKGRADIDISDLKLNFEFSGVNLCAIGAFENGSGSLSLTEGQIGVNMHGRNISCLGCCTGDMNCYGNNFRIDMYCEGNTIAGIGGLENTGNIEFDNSEINMKFFGADVTPICTKGEEKFTYRNHRKIFVNDKIIFEDEL